MSEVARLLGCRVYTIPSNLDQCGTADNALAYLPAFDAPVPGVWVGFIPDFDDYSAIYHAARKKNVWLVNTPEQHRLAMQFDRFYPYLHDLTPKSMILDDLAQMAQLTDQLAFPVFVKGAIKSNKEAGWRAVVASNTEELLQIARQTLANQHRSRGKVIIRELAALNTVATDPNGFPIGREYRAFVYKG